MWNQFVRALGRARPSLRNLIVEGCLLVGAVTALAQTDVIEITKRVEAGVADQPTPKADVIRDVVADVSLEQIAQMIGEAKMAKSRDQVKNKILKNSNKYILSVRADLAPAVAGKARYDVTLKFSAGTLRTLLLEEGLLYQADGPPKVLPMIAIQDRVNSRYLYWWTEEGRKTRGYLADQAENLNKRLKSDLRDAGYFTLSPIDKNLSEMVPKVFKNENPRTEDYLLLGEMMKASIVLRGYLRFSPIASVLDTYRIEVRLEALHTGNGRVIGEVTRVYDTELGPFQQVVTKRMAEVIEPVSKDLTVQLNEAWKRGTFGASLIKLSLKGNLTYQQLEEIKKQILAQNRDIKGLRERLFEPGQVTFEIDASATPSQLGAALAKQKFARFKVEVAEVRTDGVALTVKGW